MRSYSISGVVTPEELENLVRRFSSEVETVASYSLNGTEVTVIGAGKYYLRTNDRIGFYLCSAASGTEQRIDFSSVGGGGGLLNINLGSKNRYEEEASYVLEDFLQQKGLSYQLIE